MFVLLARSMSVSGRLDGLDLGLRTSHPPKGGSVNGAVNNVLELLDAMERQHRGEDVEANIQVVLDRCDDDPELAGETLARSVKLLWYAITNVARTQGLSYRTTVEEFDRFIRSGYEMPDEHEARREHLESIRGDKEDVRPTWPTERRRTA